MKIAVIGPESTVNVIMKVANRDIPDEQVVPYITPFYEEDGEIADRIQKSGTVDAILFSGPSIYHYALRMVEPTIPWGYLPHSKTSILQALLTARTIYNDDLHAISVDCYEQDLVRDSLESCGIMDASLHMGPIDYQKRGWEKRLYVFHRDHYLRGQVTVCFTTMEHIREPLLEEGIPCIRILPAEEVIREQIYHLKLRHFTAQEIRGKIAVIAIQYNYFFDKELNLPLREWEKIRYQNEFRERVFAVAQKLEAGLFAVGTENFFLICTRNMLINGFMKNGEHDKLVQFGRRGPEYQVWIGIGLGSTMLEAKSRANMALNQSVMDRFAHSYLVEDQVQQLETEPISTSAMSMEYFAQSMGLSQRTLERLCDVLQESAEVVTAAELAERMGLTVRSVNRILITLGEHGYVTTVGHRSAGKGRPMRLMKIALPEEILARRGNC